jgi:hypothetical protein
MTVWRPSTGDAGDADFLRGVIWNFAETLSIPIEKTTMEKTWNEAKKKIDDENKPMPSAPKKRILTAGIFKTRIGRELQAAATTPAAATPPAPATSPTIPGVPSATASATPAPAARTPAPAATTVTPTISGTGTLDALTVTFSDSGYAVTMYNKSKRLRAINMNDIWTPALMKDARKYVNYMSAGKTIVPLIAICVMGLLNFL